MANKLTDALAALSEKTKTVENKIASAHAEAREKLDARIAESKAELAAKKENFISTVETAKANSTEKDSSFKDEINQKVELLKAEAAAKKEAAKNKVEGKKQQLNVALSEIRSQEAFTYADHCVELAMIALAEVETATLEAFSAKLKLDDLKKENA